MVETIKLDSYTFHRYPDAKQSSDRHYYKGWVDGKKISLHQYIWRRIFGEIPKGFTIHHVDGDFDNNVIENYELKERGVHTSEHYDNFSQEYKDNKTKILLEKALPKASEWHGSPEGILWHKKVAYHAIYGDERTFVCFECGNEFKTRLRRMPIYCSARCKNRHNARKYRNRLITENNG